MKESIVLLAGYNKAANADLYSVLRAVPPDLLTRDSGSFFGSVMGILNHILLAELGWLTAWRRSSIDFPALESPVLDYEDPGWGNPLYDEFNELASHRSDLDEVFISLAEGTDETTWNGPITLSRRKRMSTMQLSHIFLHLMNHATHHRGAIAQVLDESKAENDYSNLIHHVPMTTEPS